MSLRQCREMMCACRGGPIAECVEVRAAEMATRLREIALALSFGYPTLAGEIVRIANKLSDTKGPNK